MTTNGLHVYRAAIAQLCATYLTTAALRAHSGGTES